MNARVSVSARIAVAELAEQRAAVRAELDERVLAALQLGAVIIEDLAERVRLNVPHTRGVVDRLERNGLVCKEVRFSEVHGRRRLHVELVPAKRSRRRRSA